MRVTQGNNDESDSREYSIELEECVEDDVPNMLDMFDVGDELSFVDLEKMGWRGKPSQTAKIYKFEADD